jgi:hypothetical protein
VNERDLIIDWLAYNKLTIDNILRQLDADFRIMVETDSTFYEEIVEQYHNRSIVLVGEEISRQLGLPIDTIFEVLEKPEVQEYLTNDSLCSNDYPRESTSE